jgi:hypothetical protein
MDGKHQRPWYSFRATNALSLILLLLLIVAVGDILSALIAALR